MVVFKIQAQNIDEAAVVDLIRLCNEGKCDHEPRGTYVNGKGHWAFYYEIAAALQIPEKVVLAKLSKMVRRGVINGCTCGCRGDFELP